MKKIIVFICFFTTLFVLMFVNVTLVNANGYCNKRIDRNLISMKEFAYEKFLELNEESDYKLRFYKQLFSIFNEIRDNSHYNQIAPDSIKSFFS